MASGGYVLLPHFGSVLCFTMQQLFISSLFLILFEVLPFTSFYPPVRAAFNFDKTFNFDKKTFILVHFMTFLLPSRNAFVLILSLYILWLRAAKSISKRRIPITVSPDAVDGRLKKFIGVNFPLLDRQTHNQ